jgi:putative aldouronate transport system substrate-binding protein
MRKTFRYNFLYVLILALVLIQTGCTVIEPGTTVTGDETSALNSRTPDNNLPVSSNKLVWYMLGSKREQDMSDVIGEVNKILLNKINIPLDMQVFSSEDEYVQRVSTALAAKEPVDIVLSSKGLIDYRTNAIAGNFNKLGIYMLKYPALRAIIDEDYMNYFEINDDIYGIPAIKTNAHNRGFLLRNDLVHKYQMDLDSITTLESLEPYLEIIRVNELQIIPLAVAGMDISFGLLDWDLVCDEVVPGALYPNKWRNEIVNQFLAPESIEYYKLMRRWSVNGYMHKDAASMQNITELLRTRRYFAAIQELKPGMDAQISESTGIEWIQVDITNPIKTNNDVMDATLSIPSGSNNPEKAFLFMEMLYTDPDLKNLLDHGIENVHYNMASENVISRINPQTSGYNPGFREKFGDMFLSFITDREDPLKYEKITEYNNKSTALNSLGFSFDQTDMEPQISACKNVVSAYCNMLFAGSLDVDSTIEQFEKELKVCGVEDLLLEMQYQYDVWRSRK